MWLDFPTRKPNEQVLCGFPLGGGFEYLVVALCVFEDDQGHVVELHAAIHEAAHFDGDFLKEQFWAQIKTGLALDQITETFEAKIFIATVLASLIPSE